MQHRCEEWRVEAYCPQGAMHGGRAARQLEHALRMQGAAP